MSNYKRYEVVAERLKAMAHPMRICILKGLSEQPCRNVSTMQECLDVPQSTLSQQLSILRRAGLVVTERKGKNVEYQLANEEIIELIDFLINEG